MDGQNVLVYHEFLQSDVTQVVEVRYVKQP